MLSKPRLISFLMSAALFILLVAITLPTYYHYSHKIYYREIVNTAERFQMAITQCLRERNGNLADCDAGRHGIPNNITQGSGLVASATIVDGVITVTPRAMHHIKATDTYILTPKITPEGISWTAGGGGCYAGFSQGC